MSETSAFDGAFRRLYEREFPSLFRYLDRLTGDADGAADLAQEAFVRLHRRGEIPDDPRAWLGAVATNLFRDEHRRRGRRERLLVLHADSATPSGAEQADAATLAAERRTAVRAALDTLTPRDREMLLLRHEGYSYREISRALGIAETSVGTMLLRATAAFRAAFPEAVHAPE